MPSADNNSHYAYCVSKAIPEGSNLYYASLFETNENKQTVIGLHALLQELNDILVECSDPGVARIKYKWWLEELERLQAQQARHPISLHIQQHLAPDDSAIQLLNTAVSGFEVFLLLEQPESFADSLKLFKKSAGNIWRYCAIAMGINDDSKLDCIEQMAASYQLLLALQQPNTFMTESCCVLPREHIQAGQLLERPLDEAALREGFSGLIKQVMKELETSYHALPKQHRRDFKHGFILNRIALKTAREIVKSDCQLLSMRVGLTPIRKLMLAWLSNLSLR